LPIDIAVDVVKKITQRYPPPYTLFASGGVDSQSCIYAWIKAGVEFKVVFVKYEQDFNEHDFSELKSFRDLHDFKLNILNFNVVDFLTKDLKKYVTTYKCVSPMMCTHFAMSELVTDGTIVFSGSYALPSATTLSFVETSLLNYKNISRRNIVPSFFFEDPEIVFSFHKIHYENEENVMSESGYDSEPCIHGRFPWLYKIKYLTYQKGGFPVIPQEIKLTGFEKIKDYCDKHFPVTVHERLKYSAMHSKRSFEIKFRYPWLNTISTDLPRLIY
jgi:hypothetical protein